MIKPEDITESTRREIVRAIYNADRDFESEVAAILNAAIEAGIVSPPVYTVRDDHGNLLDDEAYGLWATPDAAESQHKEDYTAEHWKGQTE